MDKLRTFSLASNSSYRQSPAPTTVASPTLESNDARVYCEYDSRAPPPHPGSDWTRFICLSDTHGSTFLVPPGDVVIHAGDLSHYGSPKDLEITVEWLQSLPHPVKLVIAGNHDDILDLEMFNRGEIRRFTLGLEDVRKAHALMIGHKAISTGFRYLEYEHASILSPPWNVYGSPGTPFFSAGAFQYYGDIAAKETNRKIPSNTQILITHGPPLNILDSTRRGKHAGCSDLSSRLFSTTDSTSFNDHSNPSSPVLSHPSPPPSPPQPHRPHHAHSQRRKRHDDPTDRTTTASATATETEDEDWLPHVRLHVFGHIHEARGAVIRTRERRRRIPPPQPTQSQEQYAQRSQLHTKSQSQSHPHLPINGIIPIAPPPPPLNHTHPTTNANGNSVNRHGNSQSLSHSSITQYNSPIALGFGEDKLLSAGTERQPLADHNDNGGGDRKETLVSNDEEPMIVVERVETVFVNAAGRDPPPIIVDLRNTPSSAAPR